MPDELIYQFSRSAISPNEDPAASLDILATAPLEGFKFTMVFEADVIIAVSHFNPKPEGKMAYPTALLPKRYRLQLFSLPDYSTLRSLMESFLQHGKRPESLH